MKLKYLGLLLFLLLIPAAAWGLTAYQQAAATAARETIDDTVLFFSNVLSARIDNCWHKGDYDGCVRLLKLQMELEPDLVDSYAQAAWLLWSMKRFDEAEQIYQQGIANNPDSYRVYYDLGQMYYMTARPSIYNKSPEEAEVLIAKAVDQFYLSVSKRECPGDVHRLLARLLCKLERYDESRKVLLERLESDPADSLAQRDLTRLDKLQKELPSD